MLSVERKPSVIELCGVKRTQIYFSREEIKNPIENYPQTFIHLSRYDLHNQIRMDLCFQRNLIAPYAKIIVGFEAVPPLDDTYLDIIGIALSRRRKSIINKLGFYPIEPEPLSDNYFLCKNVIKREGEIS